MSNVLAGLLATVWLTPDQRGDMVVAVTVSSIVALFAGLGSGVAYRGLRPTMSGDSALLRSLDSAYSLISVLAVFLGSVLAVLATWTLSFRVSDSLNSHWLFLAVALSTAAQILSLQVTEAWFSFGAFARGARWAGGAAAAGLAAVFLSSAAHTTPAEFLIVQYGAGLVVCFLALIALSRSGNLAPPSAAWPMFRKLLSLGLPALGNSIGLSLVLRLDRILLAIFVSPSVVATYGLASTMSEAGRLLPTSFGQLAMREASLGKTWPSLRKFGSRASWFSLAAGLPIGLGAFLMTVPVFGTAYEDVPRLLGILIVGEIVFSRYLVGSMALLGARLGSLAGRIGIVSALLCVPCYLIGSALGGAWGCALAGLFVYAGMTFAIQKSASRALGVVKHEH